MVDRTMTDEEREAQIRRQLDMLGIYLTDERVFSLVVASSKELDEARAKIAEWEKRFDLFRDAHQRGIKLWQEAHPGNDRIWPDMAKNVAWLLDEIARLTAPPGASAMERANDAYGEWIKKRQIGQIALYPHQILSIIPFIAQAIERALAEVKR